MKYVFLLGASGSIGKQTLEILEKFPNEFQLISVSVGNHIEILPKIIETFKVKYISVLKKEDMLSLSNRYPKIEFGYGDAGLLQAATYSNLPGVVVNAVVGMIGLLPTIKAIEKKRDILLANKETLVVAGETIKELVKKYEVSLFPIDSEHSAIFQCLLSGRKEDVRKIIITASGGSFRDKTRVELKDVTLEDALKHPNWSMGKKITIDSATMVNKGLEVIEAHHLFDIDYDNIETVLHKESTIHSMVEYKDGSIIAQLSYPSMMLPIQYALTYPSRLENMNLPSLDFNETMSLSFSKMNVERFPLLRLAYQVGRAKGIMPAIYNASNEAAVALFLEKKITFLEIEKIIFEKVESTENILNPSIEEIIQISKKVKQDILNKYE